MSYPGRLGTDWNRTQELSPDGEAIGGALLIHGLTDAPYSMRTIAEDLRARGYQVLALRVPGHGTVPAGLTDATWEDWLAAVRLGARHVSRTIGPDRPLLLVGYSNGGALVLKYALDALEGSGDPQAARVVLLSPMIGVPPFAWLARVISMLGPLPAFEKARWLDVYPEYNPFKYNSFAANAGLQTWRLTTTLRAQIARAARAGLARRMPPLLTFHSLVDATVSTPAVGPRALRRHRGRTLGTRALRHQPRVRARAVHPRERCDAPVAPDRSVVPPLPAHARHQRRSRIARCRGAVHCARRDRHRHAPARALVAT